MFGKINQNKNFLIFVYSFAHEENDNESLYKFINNNLEQFEKPQDYFNGEKIVSLQFLKIVKMDDRPKRLSHTGIGYHNSTYTIHF